MWPLLAFIAALTLAALVWQVRTGDDSLTIAVSPAVKHIMFGFAASFAIHETTHAMVLSRCPGVTHITIHRTAWRFSLTPLGTLTPLEAAAGAVAGPGVTVLVGAGLYLTGLDTTLALWYLCHLVFLLPFFGDGKTLITALRHK